MNKGVMAGVVAILIAVVVGAAVWMMKNKSGTASTDSFMTAEPTQGLTAEPTSSVTEDEATDGATIAGVKEFTVTEANFRFNPAEIRVKKGDTVRVLFQSKDLMHDFTIDEYEVATNQLSAGEEEEVEFTADKVGTFEYYCSVGQHRANGMVGKLIVE